MYACITRETFVFTVFRRVFHSILKLELCRHACRRRDQIIPTCRYGKNMPTTALVMREKKKTNKKQKNKRKTKNKTKNKTKTKTKKQTKKKKKAFLLYKKSQKCERKIKKTGLGSIKTFIFNFLEIVILGFVNFTSISLI